ncbi:MAG: VOC family protein [Candidatus Marinimicrobia bacterium]|nr:VOC family protein [Candidatus Neomarinimicrobiota bacterium]
MKKNVITWFEIPVSNLKRAVTFYNHVLRTDIRIMQIGSSNMGMIPHENVGGALVEDPGYIAPKNGTTIFLDGSEGIKAILLRVKEAGGNVHIPRTQITEDIGWWAEFYDLDQNRIAIYEPVTE